jgi:hypothetical protein
MKVKINSNYTEWFETKTGDRQVDTFLVILSFLILDIVISNLHVRGNIPTRLKHIYAHAGDIVIIGRTKQV